MTEERKSPKAVAKAKQKARNEIIEAGDKARASREGIARNLEMLARQANPKIAARLRHAAGAVRDGEPVPAEFRHLVEPRTKTEARHRK